MLYRFFFFFLHTHILKSLGYGQLNAPTLLNPDVSWNLMSYGDDRWTKKKKIRWWEKRVRLMTIVKYQSKLMTLKLWEFTSVLPAQKGVLFYRVTKWVMKIMGWVMKLWNLIKNLIVYQKRVLYLEVRSNRDCDHWYQQCPWTHESRIPPMIVELLIDMTYMSHVKTWTSCF